MRIRNWLIGLLALSFVFGIASSSWGVPRAINVQGRASGVSEGQRIDFEIFETLSGGASIWDTHRDIRLGAPSAIFDLGVDSDGIFNVILGLSPDTEIPEFLEDDYFLQITIAGEVLGPRQRLVATPFAITSRNLIGGRVDATAPSGIAAVNVVKDEDTAGNGINVRLLPPFGVSYAIYSYNAGHGDAIRGVSSKGIGVYGRGSSTRAGVVGTTRTGVTASEVATDIGVYGRGNYGVVGNSEDTGGYGVYARHGSIGGYALRVSGGIETGVQRVSVGGGIAPPTAIFNGVAGIIEIPAGAAYREIFVVSPYMDSDDTLILVTSQSGGNYGTVVTAKGPGSQFTLERRPSRDFNEGEIGFLIIN